VGTFIYVEPAFTPLIFNIALHLPNRTNFDTVISGEIVKRLPSAFYQLSSGREPVREWLKALAIDDRKIIGEDIKDVEFSWPIGMPLCRALGKGLWEVRSDLTQGRIARVLFCIHDGQMVLLHAFVKKTQKTPDADLELAIKRKKEIT
jgi:phage-related protein